MLRRCWIESISHWAELIFRLMYSRVSAVVSGSLKELAVVGADEQAGRLPLFQPHVVLALFVLLDEHVRRDRRDRNVVEIGARLGVQFPQLFEDLLDQFDRVAGAAGNHRQAVVLQVLHVFGDERAELLVVRNAGRQLQQQAFAEIAGADARRIELLHQRQRPLRQFQLFAAARPAPTGPPAGPASNHSYPGCK